MSAPSVGSIIEGYRFMGGDPNDQGSWEPASKQNVAMANAFGQAQGKNDVKKYDDAQSGIGEADSVLESVRRGRSMLDGGVKTGWAAPLAQWAGRTPILDQIPGLAQKSADLDQFEKTGGAFVKDNAKDLKPLSNSDMAWLVKQQINVNANPQSNRNAMDAQEWGANKRKAYADALTAWTKQLGSPSTLNPRGQSFDQFFSDYQNRFMADPKTGKPGRPYNGEYKTSATPALLDQARQSMGPAAPQRLTPQQAASLAPGTRFVGMDGQERVKH